MKNPVILEKIIVENNVVKLKRGKKFMKTRQSFISNSSSSSFIIYGTRISVKKI